MPVTPDDVIFSWELLRDKGRPNFRTYYIKVVKAEATDKRTVRFDLSGADDRELPLIIGLMPVLAKHAINPAAFEDTSFDRCSAAGLTSSAPSSRAKASHSNAIRIIGAANCRSIAACGISTYPLRLLSRWQHPFRGVQERPLRFARRDRSGPLADRLRFSGTARRPRGQGRSALRLAKRDAGPGVQHAPRRYSPTFACARRSSNCSISNGSITIISLISTSAPPAISTAAIFPLMALPANARERELLAPFPGRGPRRHHGWHMVAAGHRRFRARPHEPASALRAVQGGRL